MVFGYQYCRYIFKVLPYCLIACSLLVEHYSAVAKISRRRFKFTAVLSRDEVRYFTNTWAVRILGGVSEAKKVAESMGQNFHSKVSDDLPNIYLFRDPKYPEEMDFSSMSVTNKMRTNPKVSWAEQQVGEVRSTRRYTTSTVRKVTEPELFWQDAADQAYSCPDSQNPYHGVLDLNDPLWPKQYYIKDCRHKVHDGSPNDINLAPVWIKHRLFGKNIRVLIVDDGIETKHMDLVDNYDRALGLDLQDNDNSPDPEHGSRKKYSHGTRCAGIIGMRGNNTICGIGIAPMVTLGAVRLLGPKLVSDYKTCSALLFGLSKVHIVSSAWGSNDDGKSMPALGHLTITALRLGIVKGREGLGLIHVFAAGNGKKEGDHCGCDGLISSIYTISVASCDHRGKVTNFSERCASIMVTTYSAAKGGQYNVVATDTGGDKCTTDHGGTSASMAMVSGALALALEANPKLSWRDVQHLLAWTGQVAPLQHNRPGTWLRNAAGFYVSHDFGFGMLNVYHLVERAKYFQSVGPMHSCTTRVDLAEDGQTFRDRMKVEIITNGCEGSPSEVRYLEHVQLTVSLEFPRRGDLQIILISPSGTNVTLLERRPLDSNKSGIPSWAFDSVMTWGESPRGKWTVCINGEDNEAHIGELTQMSLTFYGTSESQKPEHYKTGPRTYDKFKLPV